MKWIKASERMPDMVSETFFVRLKKAAGVIVKSHAYTMYKDRKCIEILFVGFNSDSSHFVINDVYEWLDESPDAAPQPDKEAILNKHLIYGADTYLSCREDIYKAMDEYAAYWKERCFAAEACYEKLNLSIEHKKEYSDWQQLKQKQ